MIERLFENPLVVAVNVHRHPSGGFQVHLRHENSAFTVAQAVHPTIKAALEEHIPKHRAPILADLL